MKESISRIVMNIDSMINKSSVAAETQSIIATKKRRASNDEEYIDSLLVNNGFLNIKTDTIIEFISDYMLSEYALDNNVFNHYFNLNIEKVKNIPKNDIINKFKNNYNKYTNTNDRIDQLQFDYKFSMYYSSLVETLIDKKYIELHSAISKHRCSPSDVFTAIKGSVFQCAVSFSNTY